MHGCQKQMIHVRTTDNKFFEEAYLVLRPGAADGRAALAEFSASFGRSYREEEVRCCDACTGALKEVRASLERTLRDRRRSDEVLSLCAAAAAVLLLL